MKMNNNKAFTLVELIVVIVILAILATIAFLSFNSYSAGARDSVRLSDMTNISKGLVLFYTNSGKYPIPDNYITITASGTNIGYQGYAGIKTLEISNVSSGKDPLNTNTYYTYNTNINQNKYQLMGFLEDGSNISLSYNGNISEKINADSNDYSKRYPYTKGDQLGILLNSGTKTPIQYNNSNTGFELTSATGTNYVAYINKTTSINSTGSMIGGLAGFYTVMQASSTYPGCDTPDIKLSNGQVWAACNAGASQAWNNQVTIQNCGGSTTDCNSGIRNTLGSYFQWGRNDNITTTTSTSSLAPVGTPANNVGHNNFILNPTNPYDWIQTQNSNLWGGSGTTATGGTYYTQGQPSAMQGPCAIGYHVPTILEWVSTMATINPSLKFDASLSNDFSLTIILKLPLAGMRQYGGNYISQPSFGYYHTSSPSITAGYPSYRQVITSNQAYILNAGPRGNGLSVRCLKN